MLACQLAAGAELARASHLLPLPIPPYSTSSHLETPLLLIIITTPHEQRSSWQMHGVAGSVHHLLALPALTALLIQPKPPPRCLQQMQCKEDLNCFNFCKHIPPLPSSLCSLAEYQREIPPFRENERTCRITARLVVIFLLLFHAHLE